MNTTPNKRKNPISFLKEIANGIAIGIAFIIPGFSGGSVAAILGIYERLINAIADIFKAFKKSLATLLPILIGMAAGIIALIFPIEASLSAFPFPTVSLFVGLAIGGLPTIFDKMRGKPQAPHFISLALSLIFALSLSFLPIGNDVDLFNLNFGGYLLLFLIGIVGSAALVVPGISGSMLLLIFGYYNPIVNLATGHLLKGQDIGVCLLVFLAAGLGILVGFVLISLIMKRLLTTCPRGTYFAILGFILGSLPTVYISTAKDAGMSMQNFHLPIGQVLACILLLAVGITLSLLLVSYAKRSERTKDVEGQGKDD